MYETLIKILRKNNSSILNCSGNRELTSAPIKKLIEENVLHYSGGNRPIDPRQVEKIRSDISFHLLGTLRVAKYEDGTLAILDGQHRYQALVENYHLIPDSETIILEIIPVEDDVEFLRLLKIMNETVPFSAKDFRSSLKYTQLKDMIDKHFLPIVNENLPIGSNKIKTLFGTNRPRINENDFSKIKSLDWFNQLCIEDIFETLLELNYHIEENIEEFYERDKIVKKYKGIGFYLWLINGSKFWICFQQLRRT